MCAARSGAVMLWSITFGFGGWVVSDTDDAYQILQRMLNEWGLDELAPDVLKLLQDGHSQDQISILIQDTDAYKRRFSGNDARRKAGLAALSPAEYLATEASYRRILESAGMPTGFYDQPSDFAGWIGSDVSPTEIQNRVGLATDAAQRLDDNSKKAFWDYYKITPTDLAAYFLDRDRSLPLIQQQARAAQIGAAANQDQLGVNRSLAERLATSGLSDTDIPGAVGTTAGLTKDVGHLGDIYGDNYNVNDASAEVFFSDQEAQLKRQRLTDREKATFGGTGGIGRSTLGQTQKY